MMTSANFLMPSAFLCLRNFQAHTALTLEVKKPSCKLWFCRMNEHNHASGCPLSCPLCYLVLQPFQKLLVFKKKFHPLLNQPFIFRCLQPRSPHSYFKNISQICPLLFIWTVTPLVQISMVSFLHWCCSFLTGFPACLLALF